MNKWDSRFMGLAEHVAQWSKDPNTKVGAVVVDKKKRIKSLGFNGFPQGVEDTNSRLSDRSVKNDIVVHAEVNAMLFSGGDLDGCTLYVWPLPPCSRCAAQIIQAGIKRVVARIPAWLNGGSWQKSCDLGADMMREAGIKVDYTEETQGEFNFSPNVTLKYACNTYMRAVGVGEVSEPSCFGTPEVLNAQSRAENCCDDCGYANGCYEKAQK